MSVIAVLCGFRILLILSLVGSSLAVDEAPPDCGTFLERPSAAFCDLDVVWDAAVMTVAGGAALASMILALVLLFCLRRITAPDKRSGVAPLLLLLAGILGLCGLSLAYLMKREKRLCIVRRTIWGTTLAMCFGCLVSQGVRLQRLAQGALSPSGRALAGLAVLLALVAPAWLLLNVMPEGLAACQYDSLDLGLICTYMLLLLLVALAGAACSLSGMRPQWRCNAARLLATCLSSSLLWATWLTFYLYGNMALGLSSAWDDREQAVVLAVQAWLLLLAHAAPETHACVPAAPEAHACIEAAPEAHACVHPAPEAHACIEAAPETHACIEAAPEAHACIEAAPETHACIEAAPETHACVHPAPEAHACVHPAPEAHACVHPAPEAHACVHPDPEAHACIEAAPETHACVPAAPETHACMPAAPEAHACIEAAPEAHACIEAAPEAHACVPAAPETHACMHPALETHACVPAAPETHACIEAAPEAHACVHAAPETHACVHPAPEAHACIEAVPEAHACVHAAPEAHACVHAALQPSDPSDSAPSQAQPHLREASLEEGISLSHWQSRENQGVSVNRSTSGTSGSQWNSSLGTGPSTDFPSSHDQPTDIVILN